MSKQEQKHTPGPWQTDRNSCHAGRIATIHHCLNNDWVEVWSPDWPDSEEVQEANARLIAAAPKLLAEAKWALDVLTNQFDMDPCEGLDALREAIAEANGGAA